MIRAVGEKVHAEWAEMIPLGRLGTADDVAAAVLDGMLGADHAGFLAARWADAFLDCCEAVLGAQVIRTGSGTGHVRYRGQVTEVAVHPLGVDAEELRQGQPVLLRLDDGSYYAIDEVGAQIWELCDGRS